MCEKLTEHYLMSECLNLGLGNNIPGFALFNPGCLNLGVIDILDFLVEGCPMHGQQLPWPLLRDASGSAQPSPDYKNMSTRCRNSPGGDEWNADSPLIENHQNPKMFKKIQGDICK